MDPGVEAEATCQLASLLGPEDLGQRHQRQGADGEMQPGGVRHRRHRAGLAPPATNDSNEGAVNLSELPVGTEFGAVVATAVRAQAVRPPRLGPPEAAEGVAAARHAQRVAFLALALMGGWEMKRGLEGG